MELNTTSIRVEFIKVETEGIDAITNVFNKLYKETRDDYKQFTNLVNVIAELCKELIDSDRDRYNNYYAEVRRAYYNFYEKCRKLATTFDGNEEDYFFKNCKNYSYFH